jgi:transcriptional regulator with XRE-family HTH domain
MTFQDRFKNLIKERGLSQYRIAKDLTLNESTLRSWVQGRAMPRDNKLIPLAKYLKIHPAWLKYGDKDFAPTLSDEAKNVAAKMENCSAGQLKQISDIIDVILIGAPSVKKKHPRQRKAG